jgi:hypothetical protein
MTNVKKYGHRGLGKVGVSPASREPKKPGPKKKLKPVPPPEVIAEALASIDLTPDRWKDRDRSKPASKWSGASDQQRPPGGRS